nr:MAG TPA_asm: hypothetical protein [Caudoviricetes sp.]
MIKLPIGKNRQKTYKSIKLSVYTAAFSMSGLFYSRIQRL